MLCLFDLREQCQDALQEDRPTQKSSQLRAAAMSDLLVKALLATL